MIKMKRKLNVKNLNSGSLLFNVLLSMFLGILVCTAGQELLDEGEKIIISAERNIRVREIYQSEKNELIKSTENGIDFLPNGIIKESVKSFNDGFSATTSVNFIDNYSALARIFIKDNINGNTQEKDVYLTDPNSADGTLECNLEEKSITAFDSISGPDLGEGNYATGIDVKGDKIFVSSDSSKSTSPDLFIFELKNYALTKLSEINTGPGLLSVDVAGDFAYVANTSSAGQAQIIDVSDTKNPKVISNIKLAQFSPYPKGVSVLFNKDILYIGTTKSTSSSEITAYNVKNPYSPSKIWEYKTNTQINSILLYENYLLVATPTQSQLQVLDISNSSLIKVVKTFSPSGWQTQEGNTLFRDRKVIYFGRTVGGFNNVQNHELFALNAETLPEISIMWSKDIGSSIYGIPSRGSQIIYSTGAGKSGLWASSTQILFNSPVTDTKCFGQKIYITMKDRFGVYVITVKYAE